MLISEMPNMRILRAERGICYIWMDVRPKLRLVDEKNLVSKEDLC